METATAVQRAVDMFDGSPTKLASQLGGDIKRQHVEHWLKKGRVPAEHCAVVAHATGIPLWELRPEDWYRIWPMVIGDLGAPDVPPDAESAKRPDTDAQPAAHGG